MEAFDVNTRLFKTLIKLIEVNIRCTLEESINTWPKLRTPLSVPTGAVPVPPEIKLAQPDKLATQSAVTAIRFNTPPDSYQSLLGLIINIGFNLLKRVMNS